ncbi:hypothetical protein J6590_028854 [Homalodisca vitripennis]|nr:hypothetical protein J6590_028854 [Homalodisca vitripennis]
MRNSRGDTQHRTVTQAEALMSAKNDTSRRRRRGHHKIHGDETSRMPSESDHPSVTSAGQIMSLGNKLSRTGDRVAACPVAVCRC